jgi:hypothetical protein
MKVLDLACSQGHLFEGWFASEADYASQQDRGLVSCPVCADTTIHKRLSAPRLHLSGAAHEPHSPLKRVEDHQAPARQASYLQAMRELMRRSEDVGERFADEARRMHQGEVESRSIRGQTSLEEAVQLHEEGIPLLPLPDLPGLKEPLQ